MSLRTLAAVGALFALTACPGDDPVTPTDVVTPTDGGGDDCATISDQFPGDGESNVYYRSTFVFEFSAPDTSVDISIDDGSGAVSGSGVWVENEYFWTPSADLNPASDYTTTITWCDGASTADTSFSTVGNGGMQAGDLATKAYDLDLGGSAQFVEPPGVGGLIQSQFEMAGLQILLGVDAADATSIDFLGALGNGAGLQDVCFPSIPFPQASYTNPYFIIPEQDATLALGGSVFTFKNLEIDGAFSADGGLIAGASLAGSIDTREFLELLGDPEDPNSVCDLASSVAGVDCQACVDGSGNFCFDALITNITASELTGTTLTEVTPEQAGANQMDAVLCPPAAE